MTGTPATPESVRFARRAAMSALGPIGRLGYWMAGHVRVVVIAWVVIAVGLGIFAPRAEHALSGRRLGGERLRVRRRPRQDRQRLRRPVRLRPDGRRARHRRPAARRRRGDEDPPGRLARRVRRGAPGLRRRAHDRAPRRRSRPPHRDGAGGRRPQGRPRRPLGQRCQRQPHRRAGHVVGLQRGQQERDDEVGAATPGPSRWRSSCSRSGRSSPRACRCC